MKIISVPDNKTYCTVILIIEKMSLRGFIHLKAGKIFRISLEIRKVQNSYAESKDTLLRRLT